MAFGTSMLLSSDGASLTTRASKLLASQPLVLERELAAALDLTEAEAAKLCVDLEKRNLAGRVVLKSGARALIGKTSVP